MWPLREVELLQPDLNEEYKFKQPLRKQIFVKSILVGRIGLLTNKNLINHYNIFKFCVPRRIF